MGEPDCQCLRDFGCWKCDSEPKTRRPDASPVGTKLSGHSWWGLTLYGTWPSFWWWMMVWVLNMVIFQFANGSLFPDGIRDVKKCQRLPSFFIVTSNFATSAWWQMTFLSPQEWCYSLRSTCIHGRSEGKEATLVLWTSKISREFPRVNHCKP